MPKGRNTSGRSFLSLIMLLIFAILIGFLAWGSWQLYKNEKLSQQFIIEGQPVVVQVTTADRQSRTWYDALTNPVYITFNYKHHPYTTRYRQDSGWVNKGDRLSLLYHPKLDAFRQPGEHIHFSNYNDRSRLIQFSITNMLSDEHKWLVLSLALTAIFILTLLGMLASIIQIPLLQHIGNFIITGLVLGGTLYFTYNSWQYYRYYQKIKENSSKIAVRVISIDHHARSRKSNWGYTYDARVKYGNEQKVIPIEKEDFQKLRPNDPLPVIYNRALNDMMPVNYTPDHSNWVVVLFMWCLAIFFAWKNFFRKG